MHYLEREFNRLIKYAQGLGVKVTLYQKQSDSSAVWLTSGEIIIYNVGKKGYLSLILDLLHELAHHRSFVASGRKGNLKTDRIFDKMNEDGKLTKLQRKVIYDTEKKDSRFQVIVHKEVGLKIPVKRVKKEIQFDLWVYRSFYLKDKWPTQKERYEYRKKIRKSR